MVARELASSGNWEGASDYSRRAVEEDPQFARGYLQLFMSLDELGQDDQAAAIGSQLVSVASAMRERERYRTLGIYYLMIGDYRSAREQSRRC